MASDRLMSMNVKSARRRRKKHVAETAGVLAILGVVCAGFLLAELSATPQQLLVIRPVLVITAICAVVAWVVACQPGVAPFSEIGFVYLAMAFAYAAVPAIRFVVLDVRIPIGYDNLNFAALSPSPQQIGDHYWRHVVFFAGVAVGFLAVRLRPLRLRPNARESHYNSGYTVAILTAIVVCSAAIEMLLSAPVSTYIEHYTRFDHLPWGLRHLATLSIIARTGSYFVLLALLFSDYRRYRGLIVVLAPLVCAYEVWYSMGSRIVGATILLAVFAFYNLRVKPVRVVQGAAVMGVLALVFSAVGLVRSFGNDLTAARQSVAEEKAARGDEFDAVFATSFHIYHERLQGTLPDRDWRMFAHELIALVPFVDHKTYNPQYWYAAHYFPAAPVPPTTMGVIAESGLWGGEVDLFVRSVINGLLFAALTRWFLRRRHKWWALTIYVYCYANCIMTLKYSVLYLTVPLLRVVIPAVIAASILLWWENGRPRLRRARPRRNAPPRRVLADPVGILSQ
jgi:hypothetical protein